MWSFWKACQLLYMCFTGTNTEWACLRGWVIEDHIKHISLLSGSMSSKNIIWILHGVHQHHHLKKRERKAWIWVHLVTSYYSFYIHCIHAQSVYQNHSSLLLATWQYTLLVITANINYKGHLLRVQWQRVSKQHLYLFHNESTWKTRLVWFKSKRWVRHDERHQA